MFQKKQTYPCFLHHQNVLKAAGLLFLTTALFPTAAFAAPGETTEVLTIWQIEGRTVSGVITDKTAEPVIGLNIIEKGTTNGTITDMDGNFTLEISSPNAILSVSFIGFKEQQIPVNNQKNFKIKLAEDSKALDEVVVVG